MNTPEKLDRPHNEHMDNLLGLPHKVLDHGFIRVVDYMGDEPAIAQAARVSYGKGTKATSEDRGLLRYLMRHRHSTPFEMCEIKLHVKLPVFVARQWIRHRTANVNEYSARYSILDNEFYVPEPSAIQPQSKTNKQGRDGELPDDVKHAMLETIRQHSEGSYQLYEEMHTGWPFFDKDGERRQNFGMEATAYDVGAFAHEAEHGMAREMARMVLPVNVYTEWYWKVDLHNLLHFLSLRADPHAQMEIRVYADIICEIVKGWCPNVWEAFEDYRMNAHTFSGTEMGLLRTMLRHAGGGGSIPELESCTELSAREVEEFNRKLRSK